MHPPTPESTQKQKRGKSSYLFFFYFPVLFFFAPFLPSFLRSFPSVLPPFLLPFSRFSPIPSSLSPLTLHHVASRCCCPSSGPGSSRWIKGRPKDSLSTQDRICAHGPHPCFLSLSQGCICFLSLEREGPSFVREIPIPQAGPFLQEGMNSTLSIMNTNTKVSFTLFLSDQFNIFFSGVSRSHFENQLESLMAHQ